MKKKIVLIICVLLVLAAGAGIGYKFTRMTVKMNLNSDTVVYQNRTYHLSETARAVFSRDSSNVSSLCDNLSLEPVDFRTRQFGRYGLLVFGLSWYHLTHSPTTVSLRLFLILWIVCFCLIAAELVAAVHRSVVLGGETYLYAKNLQGAILSLSSMRPERPRFGISTARGARWTGTTRLRAIWCKIHTERRMEMGGDTYSSE